MYCFSLYLCSIKPIRKEYEEICTFTDNSFCNAANAGARMALAI